MLTPGGSCVQTLGLGRVWGWRGGAGVTWGATWVSSYGTVLSLKAAAGGQGGRWGLSNLSWRPRSAGGWGVVRLRIWELGP